MPPPPSAPSLLKTLFEDPAHPLVAHIAKWAESALFRAFAQEYHQKIRKKLRGACDDNGLRDLAWELEVAFRLTGLPGFRVAYEPGGVGERRGPDFVVMFKGHTPIGVEATRMRQSIREQERAADKLGDIVCAKLDQLVAGSVNVLAVGVADDIFAGLDIPAAMKQLVQRAEQQSTFLMQRGYASPADFFSRYRRLSAIVIAIGPGALGTATIWRNPQAQRPLPDAANNAFKRWNEHMETH